MAKVLLRQKYGSHDQVERVFAYDRDGGNALCLLRDYGGRPYLAELQTGDLEAVRDDPKGTFEDVSTELAFRAELVIPCK